MCFWEVLKQWAYITFDFYLLHLDSTCKYLLNLLGLFLPIFNWSISFHILHTFFAFSAMIPAATLKCHRRWCWVYGWSLLTVSSWLGWAVVNYCSFWRQNWNINITSLNMFVFISFDWWKITSQVFFFFSIFRWLLSISFNEQILHIQNKRLYINVRP